MLHFLLTFGFPLFRVLDKALLSLQSHSDMDKLTAGIGEGVPEAGSKDPSSPLANSVMMRSVFYQNTKH